MATLTRLLADLDRTLNDQGAPVRELLAPGLPGDVVAAKLNGVFGFAPEELVEWFGWHNGLLPPVPHTSWYHQCLVTCWTPASLERGLDEVAEDSTLTPGEAPLTLVMDFARWSHRITADTDSATGRVVITYWPDGDPPVRLGSSLADLVRGWLEAFDRRLLYWDPQEEAWGMAEGSYPALQEINERAPLW